MSRGFRIPSSLGGSCQGSSKGLTVEGSYAGSLRVRTSHIAIVKGGWVDTNPTGSLPKASLGFRFRAQSVLYSSGVQSDFRLCAPS